MWDKKVIAISDRHLLHSDFMGFIERLARTNIDGLILREKDMSENAYFELAKEVLKICNKGKIKCILHNFDKVALRLGHRYFHCPLAVLRQEPRLARYFHLIGTSIHSFDELCEAQNFGCNYALFGHIFPTLSKAFAAPKGVGELKTICKQSKIPIYAVGGIKLENISQLANIGIAGLCIKSAFVSAKSLKSYIKACKLALNAEKA